ncbi:MAG TPA: DUF2723 domain-containing protein [Gemmatimonadales bacterium]|nr:DUF2723 domain-containing protein [Gemmatimonadales bacterium]
MTDPIPTEAPHPPYFAATLVTAAVLGIYVATLAPTTAFWDTSEYIAAAKVLGIPHPPGNPLFTLMAHVWGLLPLASSYAARINLFAAVTSAAASGFLWLVAERWLRGIVPVKWARYAAATAGTLVGAFSWTVWNQSTVNEKVYTVSLFSIALMLWLAVRWADEPESPRRERWLVAIAYLSALTSTNHMMGVLVLPAIGLYVLWTDWRVLLKPWLWVAVLCALAVGISINYLYLPIRAGQYPPINEGEPVGFFSKELMDVLNRVQYQKPPVGQRQAAFGSQIANYAQYWTWQFARDWGHLGNAFAGLFTLVGLGGLVAFWRTSRREGLAAAALLFTLIPLLIWYLNFKYGFSMHPEQPDLAREVRERDYFFVASFLVFGLLVAGGLGAFMRLIADAVKGEERRGWIAAAPVLLLGLVPLFGNRLSASRAHETSARDFAVDLLESVEPYGILIVAGDNDTFPLWYAQEVEGIRPDVTIANLSLMNTRWHLKQLERRETPGFDLSKSIALWGADTSGAVEPWQRPTTPALGLTMEQIEELPEYQPVPENSGIKFDSLEIAFGQNVLLLQDLATLSLIRTNMGKRPIFFSWSTGSYPDQTFGLSDYLVSQGFVRKLMPTKVTPSDSIVLSPVVGFMDLPRTKRLMWENYHWQSAARERPFGWIDPPSGSILQLYAVMYQALGVTLRQQGDTAAAVRADSIAAAVRHQVSPVAPQ